jgi:hypothetical protein
MGEALCQGQTYGCMSNSYLFVFELLILSDRGGGGCCNGAGDKIMTRGHTAYLFSFELLEVLPKQFLCPPARMGLGKAQVGVQREAFPLMWFGVKLHIYFYQGVTFCHDNYLLKMGHFHKVLT